MILLFILTNNEPLSGQIENYVENYIPKTYENKFIDLYLKDVPHTDGATYVFGFIDTMHVSTYSDDPATQKAEKENEERILKSKEYVRNLETPEGTICIAKLTSANVFELCPYYLSIHISIDDEDYSGIDKQTLESHVKDQVKLMISDMNAYTSNKLNAEISVVSCKAGNDLYDGEHNWNWYYIQGNKKTILTPMYFERDIYDSYKGKFW